MDTFRRLFLVVQLPMIVLWSTLFLIAECGNRGTLDNGVLRDSIYPTLRRLEGAYSDLKFRTRGPRPHKQKIVIVAVAYGAKDYRQTPTLIAVDQWTPVKVHRMGQELGGSGKVLTLAPVVPLEGGLEIYKELVTGPFAWRTARFLPEHRRRALGMISEDDLPDMVRSDPPVSVLVGFEKHGVEEGLTAYAQRDSYTPTALTDQIVLWAAPR